MDKGFWGKAYNFSEKLMNPIFTKPERFGEINLNRLNFGGFKFGKISTKYLWLAGTIAVGIGTFGLAHAAYHTARWKWHPKDDLSKIDLTTQSVVNPLFTGSVDGAKKLPTTQALENDVNYHAIAFGLAKAGIPPIQKQPSKEALELLQKTDTQTSPAVYIYMDKENQIFAHIPPLSDPQKFDLKGQSTESMIEKIKTLYINKAVIEPTIQELRGLGFYVLSYDPKAINTWTELDISPILIYLDQNEVVVNRSSKLENEIRLNSDNLTKKDLIEYILKNYTEPPKATSPEKPTEPAEKSDAQETKVTKNETSESQSSRTEADLKKPFVTSYDRESIENAIKTITDELKQSVKKSLSESDRFYVYASEPKRALTRMSKENDERLLYIYPGEKSINICIPFPKEEIINIQIAGKTNEQIINEIKKIYVKKTVPKEYYAEPD